MKDWVRQGRGISSKGKDSDRKAGFSSAEHGENVPSGNRGYRSLLYEITLVRDPSQSGGGNRAESREKADTPVCGLR